MHNWSVDTKELEKNPEAFAVWKIEQMVNFGTDGERIPRRDLETYWERLTLDPDKKRFIGFLLWGEKFLHKNKQSF